jgi:hypothetical protein
LLLLFVSKYKPMKKEYDREVTGWQNIQTAPVMADETFPVSILSGLPEVPANLLAC